MEHHKEWYSSLCTLHHKYIILLCVIVQNTATVTVSVTDVNDHTPQCVQSVFAFTAAEANILRVELGSVSATDGDGLRVGSGQLFYRLGSTNLQNNITVTSSVRSTILNIFFP